MSTQNLFHSPAHAAMAVLLLACGNGSSAGEPSPADEQPEEPRPAQPVTLTPPVQPVEITPPAAPAPEPSNLSWAGRWSVVTLGLKVGIDAGGGQASVNAAGDLLLAGPVAVGSGADQQYYPALTRRDAAGNGLWSRAYESDARLFPTLLDDGSTLAAGYFTGSLRLPGAELESARNPSSTLGSASSLDGSFWRGAPSQDIVLFRLTSAGDVSWAKSFGGAGDQAVRAIQRTPSGELLLVGSFQGQLAMGDLSVTSSGGGSGADVFIARLDAEGNALSLWREQPLYVDATALASDGSLWIAGRSDELTHNQLWRLGPDGQRLLALDVGDGNVASASRLLPGPAGSVYVLYNGTEHAQLFGRPSAGDGVLVRLSPAGEVEWLQALGTEFTVSTLAADAAGNLGLAGSYRSSINLGAGPLPSSGALDIFVASFSPEGALRYSFRLGGGGSDGVYDIVARPAGGWLIPFYTEQPITLLEQRLPQGEHLLWIDER